MVWYPIDRTQSAGQTAAINDETLSRHITRRIAREIHRKRSDFPPFADAPERNPPAALFALFGRTLIDGRSLQNKSRHDDVDANLMRAKHRCRRLRQRDDAGFGRRISKRTIAA